ncbi:alkaline phosphatase family protein [Polaribacter sp. ALD11]|uniref:alkaline phosphatase family protein n=1 Tax=Polaribacter sp. ALD11 TaxID=2058137 RepID=UPI0012FE7311|nr:alkaline phosphatase family protein [Polaribacter sp. ALD11]
MKKKSPYRLLTTTVADQLRLAKNKKNKTIGKVLKDRSTILAAFHTANRIYWFDGRENGTWFTSSYYTGKSPQCVNFFNYSKIIENYLSKPWKTLYDINTYTRSISDDNESEKPFKGEEISVFPDVISNLRNQNDNFSIIASTPSVNLFTNDFAKAAIIGEKLATLPPIKGHQFGLASKKIEDTYLHLDKDLADLFSFLDNQVGEGNYTLFLTNDHGAVHVPYYLQTLKIPADYFNEYGFETYLNNVSQKHFNSNELIENVFKFNVSLNHKKIESLKLDVNIVSRKLANEAIKYKRIYKAATARTLQTTTFTNRILNTLKNRYSQKISRHILLIRNSSIISRGHHMILDTVKINIFQLFFTETKLKKVVQKRNMKLFI